jgi:Mrp family chromosome partitioning ATPase
VPPNPSELLGSDRAQVLLESLRGDYRYILIDTPPLLEVTDGAILTAMSDGALVLVRTGRTTRDGLRRALAVLAGVSGTVLGVVTTFESQPRPAGKGGVSPADDSKIEVEGREPTASPVGGG